MNPAIAARLDTLVERAEELNALLSDPEIISNQKQFRTLSQEHAEVMPVVHKYESYTRATADLAETEAMLKDSDKEMRTMAEEELPTLKAALEAIEAELQLLLLPKDPNDERNIFLEIRAGTGGDEASLFAADLFRMYAAYAEKRRWQVEIISESSSEVGGYKEIISRIVGKGAYSRLKFESGAHRVQRVPQTEAQGRIHTSACTVAIMPEVDEIDGIDINPADLRIDTYRASGAGGQHVNRTDSAVRITHIPTGVVSECQDERSQHKNKAKAMAVLQARLLQAELDKQQSEQAATRKRLVGSGDRSERIRTYNFPQGRVTDHRINLTLYKLDQILAGDIDEIINPLIGADQADQLASLGAG